MSETFRVKSIGCNESIYMNQIICLSKVHKGPLPLHDSLLVILADPSYTQQGDIFIQTDIRTVAGKYICPGIVVMEEERANVAASYLPYLASKMNALLGCSEPHKLEVLSTMWAFANFLILLIQRYISEEKSGLVTAERINIGRKVCQRNAVHVLKQDACISIQLYNKGLHTELCAHQNAKSQKKTYKQKPFHQTMERYGVQMISDNCNMMIPVSKYEHCTSCINARKSIRFG